jgi:host factor-I protein
MGMQVRVPPLAKASTKAPEQTFEEPKFLRHLIDQRTPVDVKLLDNQVFRGVVEYYDVSFLRLTRDGEPNLFLYKDQIKYLALLENA